MWFKNLCPFSLLAPLSPNAEVLEAQLRRRAFHPVARTQPESVGWVSPVGRDPDGPLVHAANGHYLLCLKSQTRLLPASVVRELLEERVAEREARDGQRPGRKEVTQMKEDLVLELLPQAFVRSRHTQLWVDPQAGRLVVDASSWKQAEDAVALLRQSLDEPLRIRPWQADAAPADVLTGWVVEGTAPAEVALCDEAVFADPQSDGAEVRVKRQDLQAEEILTLIRAGKRVRRLALEWHERLSCVLDTDLTVKRLKFLDVVREEAADQAAETAAERLDADFALMTLELGRFLPRVHELLGVRRAEEDAA